MVEKATKPDYALSSHVAALGLTFSLNSALPAPYANGAFVGEHGSWNRHAFNGYRLTFIPFENGKPAGKTQDVVTGFINGDQARGRPVGLGIDGTGALLIADDAGNTVWRVTAADGAVTPQPVGTDQMAGAGTMTQGPANEDTTSSSTPSDDGQQAAPLPQPAQTEIAPAAEPN